ncbi:hypothetical protein G7Y89_g14026 [Cudoniella acicularis]|uniref:Uncharacterized protein n=1 Tax=Cudoniella acicularis TaxID=354080 RepID=A0A8H4VVV9_9HELO|nr:hypothetical protein G7Y89_g14026 [Cudoniella acicularis]
MNPLDNNIEVGRNDNVVVRLARKREECTVGWICALPTEPAAARAMFDERHKPLPQIPNDSNDYDFSIRNGLIVGIGCGVPKHGAHLGDVVISKPSGQFGGVAQYDFGKSMTDGRFIRTGSLNSPPKALLAALAFLQSNVETYGNQA